MIYSVESEPLAVALKEFWEGMMFCGPLNNMTPVPHTVTRRMVLGRERSYVWDVECQSEFPGWHDRCQAFVSGWRVMEDSGKPERPTPTLDYTESQLDPRELARRRPSQHPRDTRLHGDLPRRSMQFAGDWKDSTPNDPEPHEQE